MSFGARTRRAAAARAGFSLIEVMTVIVILSILMVFLIPRLANLGESVKAGVTRAKMETLGAAIGQYEGEFGDYPPSSWNPDWGSEPNKTNAGAEMLFLSLFSPEFESGLAEDDLDNTDRDQAKKSLSSLGSKDLFELTDEWDNPIAYFHRRDYGREDLYVTYDPDTGEEVESRVKALNDPQTKSPSTA